MEYIAQCRREGDVMVGRNTDEAGNARGKATCAGVNVAYAYLSRCKFVAPPPTACHNNGGPQQTGRLLIV